MAAAGARTVGHCPGALDVEPNASKSRDRQLVADGISRLFQAYGHAAVSVAEGGTVIDPEVVSALLRRRANVVRTSTLSEREDEVL
jgi:hypothetical protein